MKKIVTAIIVIIFLLHSASAAEFSGDSAKALLEKLCCEEFAGRKSGDPECRLVEEWAAGKFAQFGLRPGGTEGYLQPFSILCNREVKASLELVNGYHGKKKYVHGEDFQLITNSGSGKIKAEVIFVGYGICEPEKGRDDFEGVDIEGKIAMIYREVPGVERDWEKEKWRDYKVNQAVEHGAAGIIFFSRQYAISGAAIHTDAFYPEVPIVMISENMVEDIFRGSGKRWSNFKEELAKAPASFDTGKIINIETKLKYNPAAVASNVIGIIPGSDPILKDEYIVVGGHLDHNGVNGIGDVFYGADDNASGSSVVLEMSRVFAAMEPAPRRSMLFILFAGEEQGLLGSKYFAGNPTVPGEKIAAMFNFDCCGAGEGKVGLGGFEYFPQIWRQYETQLSPEDRDNLIVSRAWGYGSDQASFCEAGIPAFNGWSSGSRPFYHHVEDLPGYISPKTLGNVGRQSSAFIAFMANWEESLIGENYFQRTLLYSSYTVNLNPVSAPESVSDTLLSNKLNKLHWEGLKWTLISISADKPFERFDDWQCFCSDNGYILATSAKEVKNAFRAQKLALFPVLVHIQDFQAHQIRNLSRLGVKTVWLEEFPSDTTGLSELLSTADDEGMLFLMKASSPWENLLPEEAKYLLVFEQDSDFIKPDSIEKKCAIALNSDLIEKVNPDPEGLFERHSIIYFDWDSPDMIQATAKIAQLQGAGFSDSAIKYMLGENLLDLLP